MYNQFLTPLQKAKHKYYLKNKEKYREVMRNRYLTHKEEVSVYNKHYNNTHKEKLKSYYDKRYNHIKAENELWRYYRKMFL
jgi:chromatin segregation and condensation protein Rec8/ScpA/Scc1 (kleisin family)